MEKKLVTPEEWEAFERQFARVATQMGELVGLTVETHKVLQKENCLVRLIKKLKGEC